MSVSRLAQNESADLIKLLIQSTAEFEYPFTDRIRTAVLVAPSNIYLDRIAFEAVASAAKAVNRYDSYIVTQLDWGGPGADSRDKSWIVNTWEYQEYHSLILVHHALCSRDASWCVRCYPDFALVGGSRSFVQEFKRHFPSWTSGLDALRDEWTAPSGARVLDTGWIDRLAARLDCGQVSPPDPRQNSNPD
jgi:hypothetical protein